MVALARRPALLESLPLQGPNGNHTARGPGDIGKLAPLHCGRDYCVLLEFCWSAVHFCELNMKISPVISGCSGFIQLRKSINLVQFCSVLRKSVTFCPSGCAPVTSGSDSVACQNSWGKMSVLKDRHEK